MLMFEGQVIVGGWVSLTLTVKLQLGPAVVVQVTVVVPTGKKFPGGTPLRLIETAPQLSLAEAVPRVASLTTTPHPVAPGPVPAFTSGGAVIVGGVVSTTVTAAVQELIAL